MQLTELISQFRPIDNEIIRLIARRMSLAKRVGTTKKRLGVAVRNVSRERATIRQARMHARRRKVNPDLVERIIKILITASRDIQHHA